MAVTPNFSWPTPDDSDLVSQGAAAIRSLGTAVDATVYAQGTAVTGLEASVTANGTAITGLQSDVTANGTAITGLQSPAAFRTTFLSVNFSPSTSYTKLSCFNTSPSITQGGFTVSTSAVTVPSDGLYYVSWNVRLTSSTERANTGVSLGINDTQDDVIYAAHSYTRVLDGHDESSSNASGIVSLTAGDTLHLYGRREGAGGSQTSTASVGSFSVYRIGST